MISSIVLLSEKATNPEAKPLYEAVSQGDYETVHELLTQKKACSRH